MSKLTAQFRPARRSIIDTGWAFVANAGRLGLQGVYFFAAARALGAEKLGLFAGTIAMINVFVPFCGWGSASIVVKYVARERRVFGEYFGSALVTTAVTGLAFAVAALALAPWVLGSHFSLLLFILLALSEMVALRFVDLTWLVCMSIDRMDLAAKVQVWTGAQRLVALAVFLLFDRGRSLNCFAACYLGSSLLNVLHCAWLLRTNCAGHGRPRVARHALATIRREGLPFSVSVASRAVYGDIDKTMLARMSTLTITGAYTAAYRLVTFGLVPIASIMQASTTRLFRSGAGGIVPAAKLGHKILPILLIYAIVCGAALFFGAPLLPKLLGSSFNEASSILRMLAWMPLIGAVHYLYGEVLTGSNHQMLRSVCQVGTAVLNATLNLFLIPSMSWKGAVIATYVAEGALAVGLAVLSHYFIWTSSQHAPKSSPELLVTAGTAA